jgi:hypothetical protein
MGDTKSKQLMANEAILLKKPSYALTWNDLTPESFAIYGLLCRRKLSGAPATNVSCPVQLLPDLEFSWGDDTPGREQLALNVLLHFFESEGIGNAARVDFDDMADLFRRFAEDMLAEMPLDGGCIPIEEIRCWLERQLDFGDDDDVAA